MIRLKRWKSDIYVYVRPSAVISMWEDRDGLVKVELSGKTDYLLIEGPLSEVATRLGITLTD